MKKRKKLISAAALIVAVIFIITFIASVFPVGAAPTAQEKLRTAQQEQANIKSKLKNAQEEKTRIDGEISNLNSDIAAIEGKIAATNVQLSQKEQELASAEAACEEQFSSFKTRARVMYENGPSTYIEILFAAGSFSEFLSNVEIIRNLLDYDEKVLEERKKVREKIAVQKAEIETMKEQQEAERNELSDTKAALEVKKSTQATLVAELQKQEKQAQMSVSTLQNQIALAQRAASTASQSSSSSAKKNTTTKQNYVPPAVTYSGTASGEEAVRLAKNYIGVRYVYGGTTPNGFDCSGFVQYVYRQMGISINRVAADQANNGVYVAREDLQPGDLVFFKKPGRVIHHVGMYVGNGQYIHAPYTGRTICIENLTRSDYYTARRIVS